MKIIIFTVIVVITIASVASFLLFQQSTSPKVSVQTPSPTPQNENVNIKASLKIVTGNITRNFSAEKYHNQSENVYLEKSDPSIVHVRKTGITWDDFFKTLPMELTKECLITGDGETLCTGQDGILKFYLNDVETPDLLGKEIKNSDKVLISFLYD